MDKSGMDQASMDHLSPVTIHNRPQRADAALPSRKAALPTPASAWAGPYGGDPEEGWRHALTAPQRASCRALPIPVLPNRPQAPFRQGPIETLLSHLFRPSPSHYFENFEIKAALNRFLRRRAARGDLHLPFTCSSENIFITKSYTNHRENRGK